MAQALPGNVYMIHLQWQHQLLLIVEFKYSHTVLWIKVHLDQFKLHLEHADFLIVSVQRTQLQNYVQKISQRMQGYNPYRWILLL